MKNMDLKRRRRKVLQSLLQIFQIISLKIYLSINDIVCDEKNTEYRFKFLWNRIRNDRIEIVYFELLQS